jgi:transposase
MKSKSTVRRVARKREERESPTTMTIGIDLGDRFSHYCILHPNGEIIEEGRISTTSEALTKHFQDRKPARLALEAGTHSGWVSRLLEGFGHEVLVANPRKLPGISHSNKKTDRADAEKLARYARMDPKLLSPIRHRSEEAQRDLIVIRARERLMAARTMLINATRGLVKSFGHRLRKCSADSFAQQARPQLPPSLQDVLVPLLDQIASLTEQIRRFDRRIQNLAETQYPETAVMREVPGVGSLTALTFVLTLGNAQRFEKSRDVGCYVGLRPKKSQSGDRDPQLRITKAGDCYLRKTLVQCAQYMLGPFGKETALRRWGLHLAERGGKNAKMRALVAVARKLAVLLHRLWVTQRHYEPFYGATPAAAVARAD